MSALFPTPAEADNICTGSRGLVLRGLTHTREHVKLLRQGSSVFGRSLNVFDIFFGKSCNKMVLTSLLKPRSDPVLPNSLFRRPEEQRRGIAGPQGTLNTYLLDE